MPAVVTASISIGIKAEKNFPGDLSNTKQLVNYPYTLQLTNGNSTGQINEIFEDTRTITTGANDDLDLSGVLLNGQGVAILFTKIKFLFIRNKSSARTLTVGGAAANQFINWVSDASDKRVIPPLGFALMAAPGAGYTVTADTGDILRITNDSGSSCDYDIVILGVV